MKCDIIYRSFNNCYVISFTIMRKEANFEEVQMEKEGTFIAAEITRRRQKGN